MPTAPTPIPNIPTPVPQTSDPTNFDTRADATLTAIPDTVDGMNDAADVTYENAVEAVDAATSAEAAAATVLASTTLFGTSISSLTMAAGTKTVHTAESGRGFVGSDLVALIYRPDPNIRLVGTILTSDGSDDYTVDVLAGGVIGAGGPYASWLMLHAAFITPGATAAEVRAGASAYVSVTPDSLVDAAAFITLTDAATVAWDTDTGFNAGVTLGGNRVIGAPTNLKDGLTYTLNLVQDATGSRVPTWNAIWDFGASGTPILQTGAGKVDKVVAQYNAARNKLEANFRKGV